MQIPIRELKNELRNNVDECKSINTYDNLVISKSVFGLFSKLINKFEKTKSYQTGLFIKSMNDWIDRKDNENQPLDKNINDILVGNIYMVDWNLSYSPELSYEHPCVVIEVLDDFLFVLPVSGQKQYLEIGYHPISNPKGDKKYRIVDVQDGFSKKCVIHINQVKTISKTRILYQIGSLKSTEDGICELLNEIKEEMINMYFPIEYNKLLEENSEYKKDVVFLSEQRKRNQSRADKLRNENAVLKRKIVELQSIIDKYEQ